MYYSKKTVADIDVSGKKVLLRCDFNVPLSGGGQITDDNRIVKTLPTIRYLLDKNASVIMCSHLGRPKGAFDAKYSLSPVADRLSRLLHMPVGMTKDAVGLEARSAASALRPGEAMLLENVRFHKEEEADDPDFAGRLSSLAGVFVNDAFAASHRAHASTVGIASYLPAVSGFLVEKELEVMGAALSSAKRPFVIVIGGSKVSDKIGIIDHLLDRADSVLVGGGMAYTFLKAAGGKIGQSICEDSLLGLAAETMRKAKEKGVRFLLPSDVVAAERFAPDARYRVTDSRDIPGDMTGMSIGPETVLEYCAVIRAAATIIWNGPMGVYEFPEFAKGTNAIARAVAESGAVSIVGGGDSVSAVRALGLEDRITHISTGGGASLEFLEGKELPGIACLLDK